jgi:hypothetical protein
VIGDWSGDAGPSHQAHRSRSRRRPRPRIRPRRSDGVLEYCAKSELHPASAGLGLLMSPIRAASLPAASVPHVSLRLMKTSFARY